MQKPTVPTNPLRPVHMAALPLAILLALAAAPVVAQDEAPSRRAARAALGSRLDVQLRRHDGRIRLRELVLYESEARGAVRRSQRQLDGGVAQACGERGLHHQGLRAVLRNAERAPVSAPTAQRPRSWARTRPRSSWTSCPSAGDRAKRTQETRASSTSRSDARNTSSATACCCGTARRRAARAEATGRTRGRRSRGPRSAASSPATTSSRRSFSTRTTCPRPTPPPSSGA